MALSAKVINDHIAAWTAVLKGSGYPYRQHWPPRLFRHEPVENAAAILRSGRLLSRNMAKALVTAGGLPLRDIADKAVIASQAHAHAFARLYFRPKSPTQYHIEGIRKPSEYYHGDPDTHAPVLVVMVFESKGILTTPGVQFSNGNMQSPRTACSAGDAEFKKLPFESIYHVGALNMAFEADVIRCRCAEVLAPSPLILDDRLQAILCRSPAERATLLHFLKDDADRWAPRIRVFSELGIFENNFAYVDDVKVSEKGVLVSLHHRRDSQPVRIDVRITSIDKGWTKRFYLEQTTTGHNVNTAIDLQPGQYLVEVLVDNCLGYRAVSLIDELPF